MIGLVPPDIIDKLIQAEALNQEYRPDPVLAKLAYMYYLGLDGRPSVGTHVSVKQRYLQNP